jgi:hypothetical protein
MFQDLKQMGASLAAWIVIFLFSFGCVCFDSGSGKPVPAAYIGAWKGSDGSTLEIGGNGKVNFKQIGTEFQGASLEINEGEKVMRIKFFGFEVKKFNINTPPKGNRMVLDNVTYIKQGSSTQQDKSEEDYSSKNFSEGSEISESQIISLLRETILDFNEAIQREDFSEFIESRASTPFRQQFTPDQMASSFSTFIERKKQISPILAQVSKISPSYSHKLSEVNGDDVLEIEGTFNTTPSKTYFNNMYLLEDGKWKILKIEIRVR